MKSKMVVIVVFLITACSTSKMANRVVLDESPNRPDWINQSKLMWIDDEKIFIKTTQQIRGNERLSACYDVAKMSTKASLVSEIQETIKGIMDTHEATMNENAELVLNKSRSSEYAGVVHGLRFTEDYFVRYQIGSNERIDCSVLGEISQNDYDKIKRAIVDKVQAADPRIKEQIIQKHINFYSKKEILGNE